MSEIKLEIRRRIYPDKPDRYAFYSKTDDPKGQYGEAFETFHELLERIDQLWQQAWKAHDMDLSRYEAGDFTSGNRI